MTAADRGRRRETLLTCTFGRSDCPTDSVEKETRAVIGSHKAHMQLCGAHRMDGPQAATGSLYGFGCLCPMARTESIFRVTERVYRYGYRRWMGILVQ